MMRSQTCNGPEAKLRLPALIGDKKSGSGWTWLTVLSAGQRLGGCDPLWETDSEMENAEHILNAYFFLSPLFEIQYISSVFIVSYLEVKPTKVCSPLSLQLLEHLTQISLELCFIIRLFPSNHCL